MNRNGHDEPPSNLPAERLLVQSLIQLPDAASHPDVARVHPADFWDPQLAIVFKHLVKMRREGREPASLPSSLTAAGEYEAAGGRAVILELLAPSGSGSDAANLASDVLKAAEHRRFWRMRNDLQQMVADRLEPEDIQGAMEQHLAESRAVAIKRRNFPTVAEMIPKNKELRDIVINGLARVGEVMNIVAPSKRGKSWLVLMLALCVVTGRRLFDYFTCVPGKVLVIDNELHSETSSFRIQAVAKAMGLKIDPREGDTAWLNGLCIDNVRGRGLNIDGLVKYLEHFQPGDFAVIVLDALYRFYPDGFNENEAAHQIRLYNTLDALAQRLQCVIVCIVHSSKGNQAEKSLVDVGSGSGAMARAPDTHAAIREHEETGCVVLDAVARSFAPGHPLCLRWNWPLWVRDDTLDPERLHKPGKRTREKPVETVWTADLFTSRFGTPEPQLMAALIDQAVAAGIKERKAAELVRRAAATGKLFKWPTDDRREFAYATVAPPLKPQKPQRKQRKSKRS